MLVENAFRWLAEPAASVQGVDRRQQARLLSALWVALLAAMFIGVALDPSLSMIFATAVILGVYALSRTRHYRFAAILGMAVLTTPTIAMTLASRDYSIFTMTTRLAWLALPVLVGGLTFSTSGALLTAAANLLLIALMPVLIPGLPFHSVISGLGLVGTISAMVILTTWYRQHFETASSRQARELAESEERYRMLVEGAASAITIVDEMGTFLFLNSIAARDFGGRPRDFTGKSVWEVFTPEIAADFLHTLREVRVSQRNLSFEREAKMLQGGSRWVQLNLQPVNYGVDRSPAVQVIATDITLRRQLEEELRQHRDHLEGLVAERTAEIVAVNRQLEQQVAERKEAQVALSRERDLMRSLGQAAQAVTSARSPEAVYRTIGRELVKLGFHTTLLMLSEDRRHLMLKYSSTSEQLRKRIEEMVGTRRTDFHLPLDSSHFFLQLMVEGKPRFAETLNTAMEDALPNLPAGMFTRILSMIGLQKAIFAPMEIDNEVLGLLVIAGKDLQETDLTAVDIFASEVVIAIQNARLYEDARTEAAERKRASEALAYERDLLRALSQASQEVTRAHTAEEVYRTIGEGIRQMGHHAVLMRFNAARTHTIMAHTTVGPGALAAVERLIGISIRDYEFPITPGSMDERVLIGRETFFSDRAASDLADSAPELPRPLVKQAAAMLGFEQAIYTPLTVSGEIVGMLTVIGASLTESAVPAVAGFANQASIALENAHLLQRLETYSSNLEQTVRERTEALQASKDRIEALLNAVDEAIIVTQHNSLIEQVNPAFEEQTGYTAAEVVHKLHARELLNKGLSDEASAQMTTTLFNQQRWSGEVEVERKDGSRYSAIVSISPVFNANGDFVLWVGSMRDITYIKELDRLKDEFLSITTHELRTPLTSIRGFSELLLTRDLDQQRRHSYLQTINQQARHLGDIIDDILDLSRLEAGRGLEITPEPIDMCALINEVVEPFIETQPAHAFERDCLPDPPLIYGDPVRLSQALRNLVSNAIKYSPSGGVIHVRSRLAPGFLQISVSDEGIGLTPEQQASLFEKFYRTGEADVGGTGLGLAICKLIVEGHGGAIWVESTHGEGSTFTFTVPLAEPDAAAQDRRTGQAEAGQEPAPPAGSLS